MLKAIRTSKTIRLTLHLIIATLTGICLLLGKAEVRDSAVFNWIGSQPATAQFFRTQDVWRQVYERLPNFPLENQYISQETGEVNSEDTLVSRLIKYHVYVKSRPPNYRFDWKLTMADYLGAHEYLVESVYPSSKTLKENPMEGDRAAIQKLTRAERDALINVLVSLFSSNLTATPTPAPNTSPPPSETPTNPRTNPSRPQPPQPGDAQLLLP